MQTPTDPRVQFLTIRGAARATGWPEHMIREAVRSGRLPQYIGDTGWPRVCVAEVVELIRSTSSGSADQWSERGTAARRARV